MQIGVISDTHGRVVHTRSAVRMLESLEVEQVLHCGDIGSPEIPPLLAAWPTHYVFGNVDGDERILRGAIEAAGHVCHGRFGSLQLAGCRIALLHGDDPRTFRDSVDGGQYDLVCYGHTHRAEQHRQGQTLVLNPGAVFRATPHTIALVELPDLNATIITL